MNRFGSAEDEEEDIRGNFPLHAMGREESIIEMEPVSKRTPFQNFAVMSEEEIERKRN